MSEEIIRVEDIHKHYGPTVALNGVSFSVKRGTVCGIIGENGSGKSTMASIIAGAQPALKGNMFLHGEAYKPQSMLETQQMGIAMIVQEAGTISGISVAENIFAGKEHLFSKFGFINRAKMIQEARKALKDIDVDFINPYDRIDRHSLENRKLIELARAMYDKPELLIVDETTTALAVNARETLYKLIERQKSENKAVLFISHDIDELMRVCDNMIVLRDGNFVGELSREEYEAGKIRRMLVGRTMADNYYRSDFDGSCGEEVVLRADGVTAGFVLKKASFELHKGEIVGIGGLADSGMHDLGKALFGIERAWTGSVTLPQTGAVIRSPLEAIRNKMGYVSKDRDTEALILDAPIIDNVPLASYPLLERLGILGKRTVRGFVQRQIDTLRIKCNSMRDYVDSLSGGNKQKVSFAKWIGNDSQILILDSPTRGVDVGVKASMYRLIESMKSEGRSIVLISEELPELIGMSDRVLIIKNGEITAEFPRSEELSEMTLIDYMI